jgi:protein gp37
MKMAARIEAMKHSHYDGTTKRSKAGAVWTGKVELAPDHILTQPLCWKKPRRIFVNSMGDLFHESVPDEWIDKVFAVMALSPQHTFQVLTKRAARMQKYLNWDAFERIVIQMMWLVDAGAECRRDACKRHGIPWHQPRSANDWWPLRNVWLGVSTERQHEADERIPLLLNTPASVRFISAEPLLASINLTRICLLPQKPGSIRAGIHLNSLAGRYCESGVTYTGDWDVTGQAPAAGAPVRKLDWIIVGGESGHGARAMHSDWVRSLRDECIAAGVAFFFKQWGEWIPGAQARHLDDAELVRHKATDLMSNSIGNYCFKVGKKRAGRLLDGKYHNEFPATQSTAEAA